MHTDAQRSDLDGLTELMTGYAFKLSNELRCVILQSARDNPLAHAVKQAGLTVEQQKGIQSCLHDGAMVWHYYDDSVVNGIVLTELKAIKAFDEFLRRNA